jgi:fructose-bisphosphate aldolase class 1
MHIYGYIMKNNSITTVKVDKSLYELFKINNIKNKFYLQDLVNRCMYLYMNDETFRNKIYNFNIPILSEESQLTILNFTGSSIPTE